MADEEQVAEPTEEQDTPPPSKGGKGLIIGFVSFVVLVETALFFFLVPSAEEVSALAEARLIQSLEEDAENAVELAMDENKAVEFSLGTYGETFSPIGTKDHYRIEIRMYGLIRKKHREKMDSEYLSKEGRIRNAIRMKIRNSELSELEENQLGLLRRRILTTCNHLLEEELLLSIGFEDYQLMKN